MSSAADTTRGAFVTLEGVDGAGKTTQADALARSLEAMGREVVRLREPGGTPISEKIRAILLDPDNVAMTDECELLLYEASRAQLVRQTVVPALKRGAVVLCDRFYDSTYAYQAGGRQLDETLVDRCNELGSCGVKPDATVVFDIDPARAFARATKDGADRLEEEGLAFQRRVREAYLRLAEREGGRLRVIDASGSPDEVFLRLRDALSDVLLVTDAARGAFERGVGDVR